MNTIFSIVFKNTWNKFNMVDFQEKIESLENRVSKLEEEINSLKKSKLNIPDNSGLIVEIPKNVIKNIEKIPTKNLVLISLRINSNQTINDLEIKLKKIGWIEDTFFEKHFGTSLISKGLVQPSGKNANGKKTFSLTTKGEIIADKTLEDLSNKFK